MTAACLCITMGNHITNKSQRSGKCTKVNIPIPFLVYASPIPARKSWQRIKKERQNDILPPS